MASPKGIHSSLSVLMVRDLQRSQAYYRDILGLTVTDWWAERDGLKGLALKLFQASDSSEVHPNSSIGGGDHVDIQVYVDTWADLDSLYKEFKSKGADMVQDIVTYEEQGPWKEFIIRDPDGYRLAFGGVDGRPGGRRSPIRPHIGSVTLWVRDLEAAVSRYEDLLDLQSGNGKRYGHLHVFELDNGTDLILDSNGMAHAPIPDPAPIAPQFTVHTDDIDAALTHTESLGFTLTFGIERTPYISYFNIRDIDGNVLMVCQQHFPA